MAASTPHILYLRLGTDTQNCLFDELYQGIRAQIASLASTQEATSMASAQSLLSTQSFKAVLVVDGGSSVKKHNALHKQLASYATVGGTVIFCCLFASFIRPPDMSQLWRNFNEPWESGDYHRSTFYLSQKMKIVFGSQQAKILPSEYSMKALHLANVPVGSRVYVPLEQSRTESRVFPPDAVDNSQTPAAFHKYGSGWLGYIGDVNNEVGSQALLMAMLDLVTNSTNTVPIVAKIESSPEDENPGCFVCENLSPVKKCGRCRQRQYCSTQCQREDWQGHKYFCGGPSLG